MSGYGRNFVSAEKDFKRELICSTCKTAVDFAVADCLFDINNMTWCLRNCPNCQRSGVADVKDTPMGPQIPRWWGDGLLYVVNYYFLRWFGVRLAYEVGSDGKPASWMFLHMPPFVGWF